MTAKGGFRSDLARVRGLGSARDGVHHWWMQRLTAIALLPLSIWFVAAVVAHVGADHAVVAAWLGSPVTLGLMALLVVATFHHAQLGLQVVIEDYVGGHGARLAAIVAVRFLCIGLATASILSLLVIAFGR